MRASFEALGREHRDLLIALLDAPAGLIDERELASTVRRHHPDGLSRPPGILIDRLADHFVRVTSLGVGWVHPSWRDLVIDELRGHDQERRRFLRACGVHGAMLALSQEGGAAGERVLPLLFGDGDWDALGDRIAELVRELDDHDVAHLLLAVRRSLGARLPPPAEVEARSLADYVLNATRRAWDARLAPLPLALLEHLIAAAGTLAGPGTEGTTSLADSVLSRIREVAPAHSVHADLVARSSAAERDESRRWWIPEDISAPPSTEIAAAAASGFTREDVARVLSDL
jgi:hypothetical protein